MKQIKQKRLPRIYVVRHCKTRFNSEHRIQGTLDISLSDAGRVQAKANVPEIESLGIDRIISSPLRRAYETAEIYAEQLKVPLCVDPGLRELDHGSWQGEIIDELLNDPSSYYRQWFENPMSVPIPDGSESTTMAQQRIIGAIRDIALKHDNETILIVTHKHIRAILQCALRDIDLRHFRSQIDESIKPSEIPLHQIQRIQVTA